MRVTLSPDYAPSDDEEFMNPMQLEYFRQMLLNWRSELIQEAGETLNNLNSGNLQQPDMADRASLETDHQIELRTRDRERKLIIKIEEIFSDISYELGSDPGLHKDGVESHLQELLAENPQSLEEGLTLTRREYFTEIGPVDLLCRDSKDQAVAVEIKRRGGIDGVEQLSRYLDFLNRDPKLRPVRGIFAAQQITPQAKVLAKDRGIATIEVDSSGILVPKATTEILITLSLIPI